MKKVIIFFFLCICTIVSAQNIKSTVVEDLLTVTRTKESVPLIVNSILDKFKQKRTDIPDTYWKEINNEIDYTTFINGARKLYSDNYTTEELEELVLLFKAGDMEIYKQKSERITPKLYQIGSKFGKETVEFITKKIKAYKS